MCQNSPKMLPACSFAVRALYNQWVMRPEFRTHAQTACSQKPPKLSPRSPSWRYHGPSWSQLVANLAPTSPILRPSSRQHAQKFLETRAQDAKNRSKIAQGASRFQFYGFSLPPRRLQVQILQIFPCFWSFIFQVLTLPTLISKLLRQAPMIRHGGGCCEAPWIT